MASVALQQATVTHADSVCEAALAPLQLPFFLCSFFI